MQMVKKILKDHTALAVLLGLCPLLALSNKVETAYLAAICVLMIIFVSYSIIFTIGKRFSNRGRIIFDILIIAVVVTIIEVFLKNNIPALYNEFGVYLPVISVNLIILEIFLADSKDKKSLLDILSIALCFGISLVLIGLVREVLGTGRITLMSLTSSLTGYKAIYQVFNGNLLPMILFKEPAGAFIVVAFLVALFRYIREVSKNGTR